jgi:hypothetical protein
MSGVIIVNKDETISISAPDIYGAAFKISIYSQTDKNWVLTNQPMTEYVDVITENNQTVSANVNGGDTVITISDASGIVVSEIIKIKSYYYRITKISGNEITLHKGLKENIVIGDSANISGNMSLYYIELNIADSGDYLIRAKDAVFGLEITDSLKVVPKSIETMVKDIKNLEYAILGQ